MTTDSFTLFGMKTVPVSTAGSNCVSSGYEVGYSAQSKELTRLSKNFLETVARFPETLQLEVKVNRQSEWNIFHAWLLDTCKKKKRTKRGRKRFGQNER